MMVEINEKEAKAIRQALRSWKKYNSNSARQSPAKIHDLFTKFGCDHIVLIARHDSSLHVCDDCGILYKAKKHGKDNRPRTNKPQGYSRSS